MFRTLVKTSQIDVEGHVYITHYFLQKTARGASRFSAEVHLSPADCIILDDDTLDGVESKVARLAPAMIYSRTLAGPPVAA
jgi:hypothetical protein